MSLRELNVCLFAELSVFEDFVTEIDMATYQCTEELCRQASHPQYERREPCRIRSAGFLREQAW